MNYTMYSKPANKKEDENQPIKKIDGQALEPTIDDNNQPKRNKIVKLANCDRLNLRAGVSTDSKVICILEKDTELLLIHEEGDWVYVRVIGSGTLVGLDGFVMKKFIE